MLGLSQGFGWLLATIALLQVPLWAVYVVYNQKEGLTLTEVAPDLSKFEMLYTIQRIHSGFSCYNIM